MEDKTSLTVSFTSLGTQGFPKAKILVFQQMALCTSRLLRRPIWACPFFGRTPLNGGFPFVFSSRSPKRHSPPNGGFPFCLRWFSFCLDHQEGVPPKWWFSFCFLFKITKKAFPPKWWFFFLFKDHQKGVSPNKESPGVSMTLSKWGHYPNNGVISPFLNGHGDSRHPFTGGSCPWPQPLSRRSDGG